MQHLMIDLETMGTAFNAPVLAIGAVYFDPNTGKLGERFYAAIDIEDACRYGRATGGTIKWWMGQSQAARDAVLAGKMSSEAAFTRFRDFCRKGGADIKPWGNGASFDISILDFAFPKILSEGPPWKFWNVRDCRTIKDLADGVVPFNGERVGTHHQALDDAVHQAEWVSHYWQGLRGAKPEPTSLSSVGMAQADFL